MKLWRRGDAENANRQGAIEELTVMLQDLIEAAGKGDFGLAPMIGIGCLGTIREDGSIERGAQHLPGNRQSSKFNLAKQVRDGIPSIGEHEAMVPHT